MYEKKINIFNDFDRVIMKDTFKYNVVFAIILLIIVFSLLFIKKKYYYQNIINFKDNKNAILIVNNENIEIVKKHNELIFNNLSMKYYIDNIEENDNNYLVSVHFDIGINIQDNVYKIFVCMPSNKLYDIVSKLYKLEDLIFIEVMKNVIIFKVINKEYDISYKFESNYAPYKNEQNLIENHYDILFPITADTLELISKSYIIYPSVIICLALHEPIQFIYEIPGDIKSYIKFYITEDSDLLSQSSEN